MGQYVKFSEMHQASPKNAASWAQGETANPICSVMNPPDWPHPITWPADLPPGVSVTLRVSDPLFRGVREGDTFVPKESLGKDLMQPVHR